MADLIKFLVSIVQAYLMASTWTYILMSYWNGTDPPAVIWGAAIALASMYGITLVGPTVSRVLRGYFSGK